MRLALTPEYTMPEMVMSIATGITAAVSRAPRTLPSNNRSTATTSSAPSSRFF